MQDFEGRVAVITGAASGIGWGMAQAFADAGMKLVMADIEVQTLEAAGAELRAAGHEVITVQTDVADPTSVQRLADAAHEAFGKVHVLCNNAGVGGATGKPGQWGVWNSPPESWQWVLGVNLMGVVHGLQSFVDRMIAHGEPGHVVNTSSVLGVWGGGNGIYGVSKHAVTALSEGLYHGLKGQQAAIGASVLMPGLVATRINTAARNRPEHLKPDGQDLPPEVMAMMAAAEKRYLENGMPPRQVGEIVLNAIREERFYVFTHPGSEKPVEERMRAIIDGQPPTPGPQMRRLAQPDG